MPPIILHLMRPAQGGMRTQVASLLSINNDSLLAAPPDVLQALANIPVRATYPLPLLDKPRLQLSYGRSVGYWAVKNQAQILHGHGLKRAMLYVIAARTSHLPLVMTLHNLINPQQWSLQERLLVRFALSYCHGIICVSEAVARSASRLVPPQKLHTIYNGVPISSFPKKENSRENVGRLVAVSRLSPEKGLDLLIEAMTKLSENTTLRIAGEGPERQRLETQIQERGLQHRVTLLGHLSHSQDITDLLSTSAIFCQPSREEGLGMAVLEAMSHSLPVVATSIGGLPEVIEKNVTGYLVAPENPTALAESLQSLLSNPLKCQEMGVAGRERVREKFSIEVMQRATAQFYEEILVQAKT